MTDSGPAERPRPAVSAVVPVYNSEVTVPELVRRVAAVLGQRGEWELILVDDGSADQSAAVAVAQAALHPGRVAVLSLSRNFGQIPATMAGINESRGDVVVVLDDDLQNPPEEIPRLLEALTDDLDFVYAIPRESGTQPWLRRLYSRVNWKLFELLVDMPPDIRPSSFIALRRQLADQMIRYQGPYPFMAGLIFRVSRRGTNVHVAHAARAHGASNYRLRTLVRLWLNGLTNFSILPLRVATFLGLAASVTGFGILVVILVRRILYGPFLEGWLSILGAVTLFSGVELLAIGVIGEYVGRGFMVMNQTPQFIVRRRFREGAIR